MSKQKFQQIIGSSATVYSSEFSLNCQQCAFQELFERCSYCNVLLDLISITKNILEQYVISYHFIKSFIPDYSHLAMVLEIFAIYWLFISFLAIKINLNTFKKMQSYQQSRDQNYKWEGLARNDFNTWHQRDIIIGSFTFLPLKFFALASFLAGGLIFAIIICWLKDGPTKDKVVKICMWYFNNYGKLMNNLALRIKDSCPKLEDQKIKAPIIISNHSCWFDTFYIALKYSPVSFVAKHDIQYWPIIGPLSKAINCIFVKRESENDRNSVRELIKQRIDDFYTGKSHAFPLVIYPEGTTSNNRVILNFKSGAFQNMSPVTMFCFHYESPDCLLGQDQIEQSQHIFLLLSQRSTLRVTKIQMEPQTNESCQQYKQRCRQQMAKTLQYKKVNLGYRDRLQLQKFRKTGKKETQ